MSHNSAIWARGFAQHQRQHRPVCYNHLPYYLTTICAAHATTRLYIACKMWNAYTRYTVYTIVVVPHACMRTSERIPPPSPSSPSNLYQFNFQSSKQFRMEHVFQWIPPAYHHIFHMTCVTCTRCAVRNIKLQFEHSMFILFSAYFLFFWFRCSMFNNTLS